MALRLGDQRKRHYLPDDSTLPLCGTRHPSVTRDLARVTCERCLKALKKGK